MEKYPARWAAERPKEYGWSVLRRAVKSRRPRCWSGKGSASSVYQREGIPVSPLPRPPLPPPLNAPTPPSPLRRLPLTLPLPLATATQTGSVLIVILHRSIFLQSVFLYLSFLAFPCFPILNNSFFADRSFNRYTLYTRIPQEFVKQVH